jgi:NADPH2:quinone reductase
MADHWFGNFGQISYGTQDLDQAVGFWEQQLGIGPWTLFRGVTLDAMHEGAHIAVAFDVALTWHDGRLIELIHAKGNGPSPFHDALNRPIIGLQRLAAVTETIEADAAIATARGMTMMTRGEAAGQRFIHYRSDAAPGVILELLERTAAFDDLCKQLRARAEAYTAPPIAMAAKFAGMNEPAAGTTMRAALLSGYGDVEAFYLDDVPMPVPQAGEVRVRVVAAAINPVDVKLRRGLLREWMPLDFPARLGGDISGIVDAVGEGVRAFAPGDRVAGMLDPARDGGYGEYTLVRETMLVKVPAALDLAAASALPTGVLTGTQLIEEGIKPRAGDRVLVTGAGGSVGRAAVFALLDAKAIPIAGVRASGHAAVADLGIDVVNIADDAAMQALAPFDAIADTVGGNAVERLFGLVKANGTIASVAVPGPVPPAGSSQRLCALIVRFDADRLAGFMQDLTNKHRTMPIAQAFPLSDVAAAHRRMEAGGVGGKIILLP